VTGVGSAVLEWLTGGSALAALGKVLLAICALVLGLIYRRYLGILGTDRRKPAERRAYDALRNSLSEGNLAARLYAERLTRFLHWVDRFFGDADISDRTLYAHAFGLRTLAPLWTAPAFERCLLLAFLYPILTIFLIWVISGDIGPAGFALRLPSDLPTWERTLGLVGFVFMASMLAREGWFSGMCLIFAPVVVVILGAGPGLFAIAFGVLVTIPTILNRDPHYVIWVFAGGVTFLGFELGSDVAGVAWGIIAGISASAGCYFFYNLRSEMIKLTKGALFQFLLILTLLLLCYIAAYFCSRAPHWNTAGPILLLLGLLTLLNTPFDWLSLGLTRALLRRGLELGGWWPYGLALVDAGLAAVIIAALALTMVVGIQAFDALAVHGGGTPVLPFEPLFTGIAASPTAPEHWWLYALLLSTMIPSLVNLVIGGTSLVRGLPGVPSLLLRFMPERGSVLRVERPWIATVLTAQIAAGAALGIAAQAFLVVAIIGYIMPLFGLELLDMARDVAAFNLPARVGQLFRVSL
jgi:hypothetical protein